MILINFLSSVSHPSVSEGTFLPFLGLVPLVLTSFVHNHGGLKLSLAISPLCTLLCTPTLTLRGF